MAATDLDKLAQLIRSNREPLLAGWRQKVRELPSAQALDAPTLNDHLPGLLEELAVALEESSNQTIAHALREGSSVTHGLQRLQDGYDIAEVVAEYNILRGSVHDLAEVNNVALQGKAFHILNRVLDGAIGLAVDTFAKQRALEVTQKREEYLAFVAHDLRTPLNALSLAASVLDRALPEHVGNGDSARMIRTLHRNVGRLKDMVAKVLDENSNVEAAGELKLERRAFDLWPLVEALLRDIHPAAGTASTRLVNMVPDDLVVFADAALLRRVLQNLVSNAIAYTPHGEVRVAAVEREGDGTIECSVSDDGAGIPGEFLASIFEKGESDPAVAGGTGLGLAIVKAFVEAHGGTVSAESAEGRGTTIRFTLPPAQPAEVTPGRAPRAPV